MRRCRVVVVVEGFWDGVVDFSLLLTYYYQPNFKIPMEHMKTLYSCSFIIIKLYRCILIQMRGCVVVAVEGFGVGVVDFSLLLTNNYQPNFEMLMEHM